MSIRSLTALAVARDKAAPDALPGGGQGQAATVAADGTAVVPGADGADVRTPAGASSAHGGIPQQFSDVLTSAIPTEPLAAYTALVAIAVGAVDPAAPRAYLAFRWAVYAAFVLITEAAVWLSYRRAVRGPTGPQQPANRRRVPLAELTAAGLAAGAWGLAMPGGPLNVELSGTVRTLAVSAVVIGAAAVLGLVSAPSLRSPTRSPGE